MDSSHYKRLTVSRGFTYNYYVSPASDGKPTLLFLHGFPSTAQDWRRQVAHFKPKGYGLIVPDMLGYGDTDKPLEASDYVGSRLAQDVLDIVENEGVERVVVVAHDWGAVPASRLANLYQDRFEGFAFLAAGYISPGKEIDPEPVREMTKQLVGYETGGYWWFLASPEAPGIIKDHIDSFYDIIWAKDALPAWKTYFCPTGALKRSLKSDVRIERGDYITEEEYRQSQEVFLKNGYEAPCLYYKAMISCLNLEDARAIPEEKHVIHKPVLFLGAARDAVCLPAFYEPPKDLCPKATSKTLDAGHWILLEHEKEVNTELEAWLGSMGL
ncbi:hypothetical protein CC1G_03336 [Coprinopsis cinerea okayama7|uniref:AB hydrolase-1 domain-containing protein n=1 Tax=Coprinopsis cinerea (strain Okayama-7 / 130 / ATCC MYA-4618 / FGSC 9003) TaxID=240176 RepID=A8NQV8_COPC7|nr:hypothetical protein CC1G_03336 [Coprinopsis cinerea okayama7\|eukprot:XP_001835554.1 hypothetical protein CC1G_03336 [Coprinopsis cinerea okayama7\